MDYEMNDRQKGILFRKKARLLDQAREERPALPIKGDTAIRAILHYYREETDEAELFLDGNEFRDYPLPEACIEVAPKNAARAMKVLDLYRDQPQYKDLCQSLDEIISCLFLMKGYLPGTLKPGSEEEKKRSRARWREVRLAYEKAYAASLGGNEAHEKATAAAPQMKERFRKKKLKPKDFLALASFIPAEYLEFLNSGLYSANGWYEDGAETPYCVLISYEVENWFELIWASFSPDPAEEEREAFLGFLLDEIRSQGSYAGFYTEMYPSPKREQMRTLFEKQGASIYEAKGCVFTFSLEEIKPDRNLFAAADKCSCLPVSFLNDTVRDALEDAIYHADNYVPVLLPIPWTRFRSDISLFHYDKDAGTSGVLLFSEKAGYLVVDLLYGNKPKVTAALLGAAFTICSEKLEREQVFLTPVVNTSSIPLLEKLVPSAKRYQLVDAIQWF